ncbi:MAG: SGNH/GDSL hydrolase family protein [Allorhizobium sp.]
MTCSIDKADEPTAIAGIDDEAYMTSLGVRKAITAFLAPLFTTTPVIARWNADIGSRSLYGGLALGAGSSALGGGGGAGRTFVLDAKKHRIRQDGFIRSVKLSLLTAYTGDKSNSLKVMVFRESGTAYTLVSQSGLLSPANTASTQTLTLATPIACQKGDVVAIWVKGFSDLNIRGGALSGAKVRYKDGEAPSGTWTDIANFGMDVVLEGQSPFIVSTGDSILAGYNTAAPWYTHYDALGISGAPSSDAMDAVADAIPGLSYQNFCQGNTTWADAVTKVAAINSVGSKAVIAAYGVNDIATGRSWTAVEADMNTFKAGLSAGKKLFVCEVLPWTAGDDARAAATRLFNANYATWCAANDATLISTHDAMGQLRLSTGELDDLKTSYNYDGVHLTSTGVAALADLIREVLGSILWLD